MTNRVRQLRTFLASLSRRPGESMRALFLLPELCRGMAAAAGWRAEAAARDGRAAVPPRANPLWDYCAGHSEGPGIWKWAHYFEVYQRHLARFRHEAVNVLEIGVYSGGSLGMWREYFGPRCRVYGVDIEPACKSYEADRISVFIGDQADRSFWAHVRESVPHVHVLIDDGGHEPEQQIVTLEEMLPHMPPGGVYLCEDVHGISNRFCAYAAGLVTQLHAVDRVPEPTPTSRTTPFQRSIHSIHFYPYTCVIEKHEIPPSELVAPRQGTEWQPFL